MSSRAFKLECSEDIVRAFGRPKEAKHINSYVLGDNKTERNPLPGKFRPA